ncbi:hypothetical protein Y046_6007 [Burkholderia pseudomallei MSHR2990]|nr:hypothetical protein Y046_6007 [Burkholderia pseudomallei MSHR2990]
MRRRLSAKVIQTRRRIDDVSSSISDLVRSSQIQLGHVELLLRLQRNLHKVRESLAGIEDPFTDMYLDEFDLVPLLTDVKYVRFFAMHKSIG